MCKSELNLLKLEVGVLKLVAETYPHHSVDNVIQQMESRIKVMEGKNDGKRN